MDTLRQIVILRKDLNMRKGKLVAQGAHASMGVITKCIDKGTTPWTLRLPQDITDWLNGAFTKIAVSVDSEAELLALRDKAIEANLPFYLITDNGKTEFHGVPTITALAIGPAKASVLQPITGHLPLL